MRQSKLSIDYIDKRFKFLSGIYELGEIPHVESIENFEILAKSILGKGYSREEASFIIFVGILAGFPTSLEIESVSLLLGTGCGLKEYFTSHDLFKINNDISPLVFERSSKKILIDVTDTIAAPLNSGIQRVVRNVSATVRDKYLNSCDFVKFNHKRGAYERLSSYDELRLFNWESNLNQLSFFEKLFSKLRTLGRLVSSPSLFFRFVRSKTPWACRFEISSVFPYDQRLLFPEIVMDNRRLQAAELICSLNRIKIVLIIYDLIPLYFPEYYHSVEFFPKYLTLLRCAYRISCISKYSQDEIKMFLKGVYKHNINAVETHYLGVDFSRTSMGARSTQNHRIPYILCVGTFEPRKNHVRMVQAAIKALQKGYKFKLILVGNRGWLNRGILAEIESYRDLGYDIEIYYSVKDNELVALYRHSLFTMFCSLSEGFGLPLIESAFFGKVCITSNRGSMREIGELLGNCIFVDPLDVDEITLAIGKVLEGGIVNSKLSEFKWPSWSTYTTELITYTMS